MTRAQRIVDKILANERYVKSRTFSERVYRDEPILRTGAAAYGKHSGATAHAERTGVPVYGQRAMIPPRQRRVNLPEPYRKARRLARGRSRGGWGYAYTADNAKLFVEQARLLADVEDDFEGGLEPGGFRGYTPTYEDLSDQELRCYVTWRTKYRAGGVCEAPAVFWRLHAYELICGVGIAPGREGFEALAHLASEDPMAESIREQVARWAHDYAIYYDLDPSVLGSANASGVTAVALMRRTEEVLLAGGGPVAWPDGELEGLPSSEELLDALVSMSRYRADRSRFFREKREDVAWVASRVFADMVSHCSKRRKTGLVEGFFGPPTRASYTVFPSALFWSEEPHADVTYRVSPSETYECEHGFWWRILPCRRTEKNRELGTLLHAIDARMRRAMGDKHDLKDKPLPKYQAKFVDTRIGELVELREREEAARITIDRKALGFIRSAAERTREALLTEDERADDEPLSLLSLGDTPQTDLSLGDTSQPHEPSPTASDLPLDDRQLALLRALLDGDSLDGFDSLTVSLAVDAINEVFLDIVGDTVIDFDGDAPMLVEDYVDDVRAAM